MRINHPSQSSFMNIRVLLYDLYRGPVNVFDALTSAGITTPSPISVSPRRDGRSGAGRAGGWEYAGNWI